MQPIEYITLEQLPTPPPTFTPTAIIFPPEQNSETYTHASYSKGPIPDLVKDDKGHWAFSLNVPIPDKMVYPTLTYLEYTVKYGIENDQGGSTIRTNIMLTKVSDSRSDAELTSVPDGIITDAARIDNTGVELAPQTLDGVPTMCLSSMPAVKENFRTSQWNHYIDQQQLLPHVRIIDASRLYLQLYVAETPSPPVLRSLVLNVSAAWVEDLQGKVLHDEIEEAEMRIVSAEKKIAEEEEARLLADSRSAEARLEKEIAEKEEEAAKKKSKDDQLAKKCADDQANTDRIAKQRADNLAETRRAAKKVVSPQKATGWPSRQR